jgi:hypothetical protein
MSNEGMGAGEALLDRHATPNVKGKDMKTKPDLSLWSIIERLQRRLERQGLSPAAADRALSIAIRQLAMGARG